ncbi:MULTISPECIES: hypothetical protein [unclassified Rickettsia]|uniref:hypothetical protein n=1 Tax=unclassified Rickettsia TaxID=114295 RepID=UPI003133304F
MWFLVKKYNYVIPSRMDVTLRSKNVSRHCEEVQALLHGYRNRHCEEGQSPDVAI